SACIIGTVVYMRPLEPYIEAPIFGILVPTFITGYMLIHSSDILLLAMRKDYMFLYPGISASPSLPPPFRLSVRRDDSPYSRTVPNSDRSRTIIIQMHPGVGEIIRYRVSTKVSRNSERRFTKRNLAHQILYAAEEEFERMANGMSQGRRSIAHTYFV
ncbi:unnamed protein product, partial [Heterotrigona itama]